MKTKTFVRPLQKPGGGKFESIFHVGGYKAIGDVYRNRLGGPPFPITQGKPQTERWFCTESHCTHWMDNDGVFHGKCSGFCEFG